MDYLKITKWLIGLLFCRFITIKNSRLIISKLNIKITKTIRADGWNWKFVRQTW